MIEDAELLRRYAAENSEEAFAELVRRQVDFVYACALRRVGGNGPLAEDVTQQVFIALARAAARLARREVLSGWLFTTARNVAVQVVRSERRRGLREQKAQIMHELTTSSAHDADWQRLRPVIDAALDELPERDREAVLLRFFEGKTFVEIGARLRLPENTVRMRVERALEKLPALLARRGVTSTSAGLGVALAGQAGVAAPAGLAASATAAALAVGGALAGGGVLAGLLGFMTTTKIVIGVVAGIAIGVAINESGHAQQTGALASAKAGGQDAAVAVRKSEVRTKIASIEAPSVVAAVPRAADAANATNARVAQSGEKAGARPVTEVAKTAPAKITARVSQLDGLVALTAEQKKKVVEIFERETAALVAFETLSLEERGLKGMDVRKTSREEVRAALSEEQQKIYDRTHQSKGGAVLLISPEAKLTRLDGLVVLTPAQKGVAQKIFDEEFASLVTIPIAERGEKGMEFRQAAREQVRAILNPGQQAKYDATSQMQGGGSMQARPEGGKK